MQAKDAVKRVRRMWAEVNDDALAMEEAHAIVSQLADERIPQGTEEHKQCVLAAVNNAVSCRTVPAVADRSFRTALDQGTTHMGTWRLFAAIRPQFALLPWTFWLAAAIIFSAVSFLFPLVGAPGTRVLVVIVPFFGLIGLYYTLRATRYGVHEWEQSCPITPLQLTLARIVLVLFITLTASLVASIVLVQQHAGTSFAGLVVSWLAPLLLISGLYLAADVVIGGLAGSAAAAVAWFTHVLLTQGGHVATSVVASVDGFSVSRLDSVSLLIGAILLILGLRLSSAEIGKKDAYRAS